MTLALAWIVEGPSRTSLDGLMRGSYVWQACMLERSKVGAQEASCDEDSWMSCHLGSKAQRLWSDVEALRHELRRLCDQQAAENMHELVVAGSSTTGDEEVVLQTRTIANPQVMSDWESWEPSTRVEIDGLITEKKALELS